MAGFFQKLLSVLPASGLYANIKTTFTHEMGKPGAESYSALVAAWKDATEILKRAAPTAYQNHLKLIRLGMADDICKAFAVIPDQKIASDCTARVFASLCFPAYGQTNYEVKEAWEMLIGCAEIAASDLASLNGQFSALNPTCYRRFLDCGAEPFSVEYANNMKLYVNSWITLNDVKW